MFENYVEDRLSVFEAYFNAAFMSANAGVVSKSDIEYLKTAQKALNAMLRKTWITSCGVKAKAFTTWKWMESTISICKCKYYIRKLMKERA